MFEIDFFSLTESAIIQMASQQLTADLADWEREIWSFVINWFDPEIKSISVFTSGSTGIPKAISHTKEAMLNSARATCSALNLSAGNRALLCLPVSKISGMMMEVRCIECKMKVLCLKPSTKPLSELPEDIKIDFAAFTPMQFFEITNNYSNFRKADRMGKIILGGEDVNAELLANIQKLESEVYITFGMTETISHIALKRLNGSLPDSNFKLLPGITIQVDDRSCMVIQAPQLCQPHLVTNDVIEMKGETEFKWLGRFDNVINTGGVKIFPEEIELKLAESMSLPFFIASLPDSISGQKVVIVVQCSDLQLSEQNRLKTLLNQLEKIQRPKEVLLNPKFKYTANGKLKRLESLHETITTIPLI